MKKYIFINLFIFTHFFVCQAQNTDKNQHSPLQQMMQMMEKMFGEKGSFADDSTQNSPFQLFSMPFGNGMDSTFGKAFSFSFDNNGHMTGDTSMMNNMKDFQEKMKQMMPNNDGNLNNFGNMDFFNELLNKMQNNADPSVLPPTKEYKKRKGDKPNKTNKKYETEEL